MIVRSIFQQVRRHTARFCQAAVLTAAALLTLPSLPAAESTPSPAPKASPEASPAEQDKGSNLAQMDIPVPIGEDIKGIRIPYFGEDGKTLQMTFDAEVARKLDDKHIEMENLKIDAYGDDDKDFYIEIPKSIFNLETRILTGNNSVLIRRDDFEIVGDAVEFHTKDRFGKILGNVKMIIFSSDIE